MNICINVKTSMGDFILCAMRYINDTSFSNHYGKEELELDNTGRINR